MHINKPTPLKKNTEIGKMCIFWFTLKTSKNFQCTIQWPRTSPQAGRMLHIKSNILLYCFLFRSNPNHYSKAEMLKNGNNLFFHPFPLLLFFYILQNCALMVKKLGCKKQVGWVEVIVLAGWCRVWIMPNTQGFSVKKKKKKINLFGPIGLRLQL